MEIEVKSYRIGGEHCSGESKCTVCICVCMDLGICVEVKRMHQISPTLTNICFYMGL